MHWYYVYIVVFTSVHAVNSNRSESGSLSASSICCDKFYLHHCMLSWLIKYIGLSWCLKQMCISLKLQNELEVLWWHWTVLGNVCSQFIYELSVNSSNSVSRCGQPVPESRCCNWKWPISERCNQWMTLQFLSSWGT